MLKKLFGNAEEKFVMELPDSQGQNSSAAMAPTIIQKEETTSAPAEKMAIIAVDSDATTEIDVPKSAPVVAPEPVKAATTAPASAQAEVEKASTPAATVVEETTENTAVAATPAAPVGSFSDKFLVNAGNTNARRRPSKSMDPFMGLARTMGGR
ncbi:hypothetical protein Lepto7376_1691 [[Leptolyngbya] sp. PCC 7376]|uniref:hypothetical protein n=1 Tax=[Leptolyngbya] sp. PCC 7376 TaxID=111781 RepID=UPI00029F0459|nr:hypothetical protein [[Leptolyngbya] sp. PCC 7376]AFY38025.1 hypothetical protein Lepto7376_1691 [[Leptolyngbya] sp. PCC 7376]